MRSLCWLWDGAALGGLFYLISAEYQLLSIPHMQLFQESLALLKAMELPFAEVLGMGISVSFMERFCTLALSLSAAL